MIFSGSLAAPRTGCCTATRSRDRLAAARGHHAAAGRLAVWLAERGDFGALRAQAAAGGAEAAYQLADLLEQHGDLDEALQVLRAGAGTDDGWVMVWRGLLARRGDMPRLRAEAAAGNTAAAAAVAELLAEPGDLTGVQDFLADEQQRKIYPVVDLLVTRNDLDGLRALAGDGNRLATLELIRLLAERGDFADASPLQGRAAAGDSAATALLARLLAAAGQYEKMKQAVQLLRTQAQRSDLAVHLNELLADLMVSDGDLDGLRAPRPAGDGPAARRLAALLAAQEDIDGLQALAEAGQRMGRSAAGQAARQSRGRGQAAGASEGGNSRATLTLTELLLLRGDADELRARADAGDWNAAGHLALPAEQGRRVARPGTEGRQYRGPAGAHAAGQARPRRGRQARAPVWAGPGRVDCFQPARRPLTSPGVAPARRGRAAQERQCAADSLSVATTTVRSTLFFKLLWEPLPDASPPRCPRLLI